MVVCWVPCSFSISPDILGDYGPWAKYASAHMVTTGALARVTNIWNPIKGKPKVLRPSQIFYHLSQVRIRDFTPLLAPEQQMQRR